MSAEATRAFSAGAEEPAPRGEPPRTEMRAPRPAPDLYDEDDGFLPRAAANERLVDPEAERAAARRMAVQALLDLGLRGSVVVFLGLLVVSLAFVLFVWMWHILAPSEWHWMTSSAIDRLQNFIIVASLSANVALIARRAA